MNYNFKEINKYTLPMWKVYLGFSRSFQMKVLGEPVQENDGYVYPVQWISYTDYWCHIKLRVVKL